MRRTHLLLPLSLLAAGCWDLPPGDKTSPWFWSELFLDKYADELEVGALESGPTPLATPRAVLLITGVTIEARWFGPIVARLERDGFEPIIYQPPELLSGDLFDASDELADVVARVLEETGQERIDILAECTGGLIARHYIQSLGGDRHVSRLVTFVSPQHGVDKAPLAAAIAGWPALYDLSPGSAFLRAVNDAPLPADVPVTSIYTCSDEYIQPYATSIIPGATNIGLCDGFVGHFQTFYDPSIYLVMHAALTAPAPTDPTDPTNPADPTNPTNPVDPVASAPDEPALGSDDDVQALDPVEREGLGCTSGAGAGGLGAAVTLALAALARRRRGALT